MGIEIGVIASYLAAQLLPKARRAAGNAIGTLLDELARVVGGELGDRSLRRLERRPEDERVQEQLGDQIAEAARDNPEFGRQLAQLVRRLEKAGGPQFINQVSAHTNIQAIGGGHAAGRDVIDIDVADPSDLSGAPTWVKVCLGLGLLLCLTGMLIFGYTLFTELGNTDVNEPNAGETPAGIPMAAAIFFAGFVIVGIAAFGRAVSKRSR